LGTEIASRAIQGGTSNVGESDVGWGCAPRAVTGFEVRARAGDWWSGAAHLQHNGQVCGGYAWLWGV